MEFTITFLELFMLGLALAAPLLLFFIFVIIIVGQLTGRRENWNHLDSLYWSFITATTVGYGDIRPTKKLSKLLSVLIAFLGIIFTGIIVALAINAASIAFKQYNDIDKIKDNIEQIKRY